MDDLISQKQQQASLVQAWESARQADKSTSQGRAIMLFTVVTIVFVSSTRKINLTDHLLTPTPGSSFLHLKHIRNE